MNQEKEKQRILQMLVTGTWYLTYSAMITPLTAYETVCFQANKAFRHRFGCKSKKSTADNMTLGNENWNIRRGIEAANHVV